MLRKLLKSISHFSFILNYIPFPLRSKRERKINLSVINGNRKIKARCITHKWVPNLIDNIRQVYFC